MPKNVLYLSLKMLQLSFYCSPRLVLCILGALRSSWILFLKAGDEWLYIGIDLSLKISILVGLGLALPLARYASVAGATREKAFTAGAVVSWRWGAA